MVHKKSLLRKVKLRAKQKKSLLNFMLLVSASLIVLLYVVPMADKDSIVEAKSLRPLLNLIAGAESNNNYNAYFGNASNSSLKLTTMTIEEVLKWQETYIEQGNASSAAGRYQIINTTLASLVDELNLNAKQKFNEDVQDKLAIALIQRRGASDYVNKRISSEQFAANLAKEWAALPRVIGEKPSSSYYISDGLNQSRVDVEAVLRSIELIHSRN